MEEEKKYLAGSAIWTHGPKLIQGNLGAAVNWKDKDVNSRKSSSLYSGLNKEILDAELRAIAHGLKIAVIWDIHNTPFTIFSD